MTQSQHSLRAAALAALLVLATVGAAPLAVADHDESDASSVFGDVVSVEDDESADDGMLTSVRRAASRIAGAASGTLARLTDRGTDQTASEAADSAQSEFNANNQTIQSYINARATASEDADVLKLTFEIDDESATRYVVADVNGTDGSYENASMVVSTSREVDESCTLEEQAADNAADELGTFVEEFASEDENLSAGYQGRMASQYAGEVDCSFEVRG
jgi:ribosomal protein S6